MGGEWAREFPPQITLDLSTLHRGQERFNIYCAVCHGQDGSGNGIVAKRARENSAIATGWAPPSSLHDAPVRDAAVGYHFNSITRGVRTMPAHGDQIPVADRWAIVAYIKALQLSQHATIEDAPPLVQAKLTR